MSVALLQISEDRGETKDIAHEHPELITTTEALLRQEVSANAQFPLDIPGVNSNSK